MNQLATPAKVVPLVQPTSPVELDPKTVRALEADLLRYARRKVATEELARELVQETWLAAVEALPRFAGRSSIRTWVTSILRRKIADLYRSRRETVPFEEVNGSGERNTPMLQQIMARESANRVLDAMSALSPREREAVELCGLEDLDREEAADRMGLSRPCLRVTLCRGRRHLRELAEAS